MKVVINGNEKQYDEKKSIYEILVDVYADDARDYCIAKLGEEYIDLRTEIDSDCNLEAFKFEESKEARDAFNHTSSHVLAMAVKKLYPEAKLSIGPAIENGFYYDFDLKPLDQDELNKIEKEIKKIVKRGFRVNQFYLSKDDAIKLMKERNEDYKVELINDFTKEGAKAHGQELSFYQIDDFIDLCAGPHLMNIKALKNIKILSSSGAYWKGSEKNKMLTRIYATSFPTKEQLDDYLKNLEEAKLRDHNKLGREMELFTTVDIIGQGLPLLMPKGAKIMQTLQRWIEDEEENRGYLRTKTPLMAKSDLYKLSGHWDHYRDGMFIIGNADDESKEVMALRPMTCPFQYMVYKTKQRSYRELPMRLAETSTLFRNEESGEMHGLIRLRQFTISEAHIIITPEQVHSEIANVLDLINYCMQTLGIIDDVSYRFSKWDPSNPDKYIGTAQEWERNEGILRNVLVDMGIEFTEAQGEAAFYGPKLDIQIKNVFGKEDTLITVQLDCALSEVYDMYYIDENGEKKRPYIIHRTSVGCYERTLALIIEKFAGLLPTWLSPEQVRVLPISEKFVDYANEIVKKLKSNSILATLDNRSEKIGYKIRQARIEKVPYQIIIGQKEVDEAKIAVRSRYDGDLGSINVEEFILNISEEIRTRKIREIKKEDDK